MSTLAATNEMLDVDLAERSFDARFTARLLGHEVILSGTARGSHDTTARMSTDPLKSKSNLRTVELIVRRPPNDNTASNVIRYFDRAVALTKALVWPLLCLSLFLYLRHPIMGVAAQLPTIISQSSKLSVGTLSFEIRERADATGNRELGALIEGLSPEAVEDLLKTGRNSWIQLISRGEGEVGDTYFFPSEKRLRALIELEQKGLLRWAIPRKEFDTFVDRLRLEFEARGDCLECDAIIVTSRRTLSEADRERLLGQTYSLSATGIRALDLVVKTVIGQLQPRKAEIRH